MNESMPHGMSALDRASAAPTGSGETDVAIVGAGLAGSIAAAVLGRAGYRVALIDRHAVPPAQFRVEKVVGEQVHLLDRLGLLPALAGAAKFFDEVLNVHRGRVVDRTHSPHYGIFYHDLVKVMRSQLPPSVTFVVGHAVDLDAGPQRQSLTLANGQVIESKLIILATGMNGALRHKLGIPLRVAFEKQSVSFGFSIVSASANGFEFPAMTYYGEKWADRIDYLSLFPVDNAMRANLFTFRDPHDEWIRDMRRSPKETLLGTLPGLERFLGDFRIISKVESWVMDLCTTDGCRRDGVVLIGDAFQTSCPATGMGVSRLLTDVDRLCNVHLPRWFETAGMGAAKVARFYEDPWKRAADARARDLSAYHRSLVLEPGMAWEMRRGQLNLRRRVKVRIYRLSPGLLSRVQGIMRGLRSRSAPNPVREKYSCP